MILIEKLLESYASRCCTDLFASCGVEIGPETAESGIDGGYELAGVIGFSGPEVRGSLVLASSFQLIRGTYPAEALNAANPDDDSLLEWIGELSNQLIGRIKNQLLLHGVAFVLSTPVSLAGNEIVQSRLIKPGQLRVVLRGRSGRVRVCLEAAVTPGLEVRAEPMERRVGKVVQEGDLLLF